MPRRDPAKAIPLLDLLERFFDGGRRWIKGDYRDDYGNACLVGALDYFADHMGTAHMSALWYLGAALPPNHSPRRRRNIVVYNDSRRFVEAIGKYNDSRRSFAAIGKLIARARALAQPELAERALPRSTACMASLGRSFTRPVTGRGRCQKAG
jgi:hypothetical protein